MPALYASRLSLHSLVKLVRGPIYTGPDKFLHGRKLTRFHFALHGTVGTGRIFERLSVQVWDLLHLSSKLVHLAVQKFVQFRRSRVNARWDRTSFGPCDDTSWWSVKVCGRKCIFYKQLWSHFFSHNFKAEFKAIIYDI